MDSATGAYLSTLIRISETARHLKCSTQTVRNYVDERRLRCYRDADGQRLFDPSEVEAFRKIRDEEKAAIAALRRRFRGRFDLVRVHHPEPTQIGLEGCEPFPAAV